MTDICFVTEELYPLKPGGIGRLMYNFGIANQNSAQPVQIHYLLPYVEAEEEKKIRQAMEGLGIVHFCPSSLDYLGQFYKLIEEEFQNTYGLERHIVQSSRYFAGLLKAQNHLGKEFDYIEFTDFGGVAAVSNAAKQSGIAFQNTKIAVRLHSSFGLIVQAEPFYHEPSEWMTTIIDLERKALEDADIIVGHLPVIAEINRRIYNFDDSWWSKVKIEFPPILLDEKSKIQQANKPKVKNFIFSSRLQPFKRPDLFVRAAVHFLEQNPDYDGQFFVVSYGWDTHYINWLRSLVPVRWKEQVIFLIKLDSQARIALLRSSIVVIPSDYESLCLFAYESVLLGSKVILNRRCEAFGNCDRWHEGSNCLMFDGTFLDLSRAMKEALSWQPNNSVSVAIDTPFWEQEQPNCVENETKTSDDISLSIIIYGGQNALDFKNKIYELIDVGCKPEQLNVVIPRELVHEGEINLDTLSQNGINIYTCNWNQPTSTEINTVVNKLQSTYVGLVSMDIFIQRDYFTTACKALNNNSSFALFTSYSRCIKTGETKYLGNKDQVGQFAGVRLYGGNLPSVAMSDDCLAHRASVIRTDIVRRYKFVEEARDRWFEELMARLVLNHEKFIVCPFALVNEIVRDKTYIINNNKYYSTISDKFGIKHKLISRLI